MDRFECGNSRMAKRTYSTVEKLQRNSIKQTQSLLLCGNIKFGILATNHSGARCHRRCCCSFELRIIWFYMMRFHLHSHLQSINVLNFDSLISCCFSFVRFYSFNHCRRSLYARACMCVCFHFFSFKLISLLVSGLQHTIYKYTIHTEWWIMSTE